MAQKLEQTLYVRGINEENDNEDVWDDTILNNAYDRALKLANEEVAKRIAMETNTKGKESKSSAKDKNNKTRKETEEVSTCNPSSSKEVEWKIGMPCRAVYEEDGYEYEAFLIKIIDEEYCIVKFLGYDNSDKVPISTLKPTLGNRERMRQVEAAMCERDDDGFESQAASENVEVSSENDGSATVSENPSYNKKRKEKKMKSKNGRRPDFGDLPQLPMPTMNMFKNTNPFDSTMPFPPPPPMVSLSQRSDAEEQAISDMLLSWYMTGYYTGLYQGMKRQQQRRH